MKLWDFRCETCGRIIEYIQFSEEDIPTCCGKKMTRLYSRINIAQYKSGFKPKPLVNGEDRELDPKKQDIFGRRWDDLPDSLIKAREYWRKIDDFERSTGTKAPFEYRWDIATRLFKREIEERIEEVKDGDQGSESGGASQ